MHNLKGLAGNLSATRLHEAATHMDGAVRKGASGNDWPPPAINAMFAELKISLEQALASCETLKQPKIMESEKPAGELIPQMTAALAKQTVERIRDAVEMGNVAELKSIAEDLRSRSAEFAQLGSTMLQMAEEFDFEGIEKLAAEMESRAGA